MYTPISTWQSEKYKYCHDNWSEKHKLLSWHWPLLTHCQFPIFSFFPSFFFFRGGGEGEGEIEWREGRWGGRRVVQQAHIFIPHPAFSNFTLKRLILKAAEKNQICNRMTASVLKQDPNTKRFKRTLIYYDTYTQFWGNPLCQATNWHLNNR